jgi:hypothetical protein
MLAASPIGFVAAAGSVHQPQNYISEFKFNPHRLWRASKKLSGLVMLFSKPSELDVFFILAF